MEDSNAGMEMDSHADLELTVEIVSAYVSNNPVPAGELSALISTVSESIKRLGHGAPAEAEKPVPAVPVKRSVTHDYIISLEDGRKFKSLKRPLMVRYGMTPDEYRAKWDLPKNYPMVAPGYSNTRSEMARQMGLGRKPGQKPKPAKRGRKNASQ